MESGDRTASGDLTERLNRDARRYSFFQLVRLMQSGRSGVAKVGHLGPASGEVLRFRPFEALVKLYGRRLELKYERLSGWFLSGLKNGLDHVTGLIESGEPTRARA